MSKHILFICNEYPPYPYGGIGVFVKNLSNNLVERGFKCTVVGVYNLPNTNCEEDNGVKVVRLAKLKSRFWDLNLFTRVIKEFLNRLKLSSYLLKCEIKENIDLIESYDWNGPLLFKPKTKLLVRLHGSNSAYSNFEGIKFNQILKFYEKLNLKFADEIVSVSNHMLDLTEKTFGVLNVSKNIIYNSYNDTCFKFNFSAKRDQKKIIFVGKFHERKGVYELFEILNHLFQIDEFIHFQFVGPHTENNKKDLLSRIDVLHISRVTFTSLLNQYELSNIYNNSSLMIMPSRAEAFGLTSIEAMSCGCIVAMSCLPVTKEIINDGVDGLIIDINDTKASAQRIFELLKDIDRFEKMSYNAIQKVITKFSAEFILRQNIALFNRLTNDH